MISINYKKNLLSIFSTQGWPFWIFAPVIFNEIEHLLYLDIVLNWCTWSPTNTTTPTYLARRSDSRPKLGRGRFRPNPPATLNSCWSPRNPGYCEEISWDDQINNWMLHCSLPSQLPYQLSLTQPRLGLVCKMPYRMVCNVREKKDNSIIWWSSLKLGTMAERSSLTT